MGTFMSLLTIGSCQSQDLIPQDRCCTVLHIVQINHDIDISTLPMVAFYQRRCGAGQQGTWLQQGAAVEGSKAAGMLAAQALQQATRTLQA